MARHPQKVELPRAPFLWGAGWKAMKAAAALGDEEAAEELTIMNSNLSWTIIVLGLVAGALGGGWIGFQACNAAKDREAVLEQAHIKADAERVQTQETNAAKLREIYASQCRLTPEQAERLFPPPAAP